MKKASKKKVFVGMSGGVDSSVAAALLKQAGYEVTGVFLEVWAPAGFKCSTNEDRREAMRAAAALGIPLAIWDISELYHKKVIQYLIDEYKAGRTPNPDVRCNDLVKFGIFFDRALKLGADFVATGHYAQITQEKENFYLTKSVDQEKDQTYFLWRIKKEVLPQVLFPVGGFEKSEVRNLAKKFKLPNAERKDSQGLCFVGQGNIKDFLKQYIPHKPGPVVTTTGETVGEHEGVLLYTLGERHGFKIFAQTPNDRPYYIVDRDLKKNVLIVSHEAKETARQEIKLGDLNWLGQGPETGKKYQARVRYRQPLSPVEIQEIDKTSATIKFKEPQIAAPGQSCVIYHGDICLGGGTIK